MKCLISSGVVQMRKSFISWEKLTGKKIESRLEYKDIKHFNTALLAKQVWRIIRQPNLLVSKVLKAKYLRNKNIFTADVPSIASLDLAKPHELKRTFGKRFKEEI
ncbi:hypothetical protein ACH5RR_027046 [Cinchona calisaya]|uniref:Uncharacterized protein n=1 Tax=Cinchona calisaya TaxID=153742 RepID=A0ABD2Z690_9GENT